MHMHMQTVAVKTMILPANMTGQEKREKMAVMEAAISSSLVHPNIGERGTRKPERRHPCVRMRGVILRPLSLAAAAHYLLLSIYTVLRSRAPTQSILK